MWLFVILMVTKARHAWNVYSLINVKKTPYPCPRHAATEADAGQEMNFTVIIMMHYGY